MIAHRAEHFLLLDGRAPGLADTLVHTSGSPAHTSGTNNAAHLRTEQAKSNSSKWAVFGDRSVLNPQFLFPFPRFGVSNHVIVASKRSSAGPAAGAGLDLCTTGHDQRLFS
jgi:hypothetical protein